MFSEMPTFMVTSFRIRHGTNYTLSCPAVPCPIGDLRTVAPSPYAARRGHGTWRSVRQALWATTRHCRPAGDRRAMWACRKTGPLEPSKARLLDCVHYAMSRSLAGLVLLLVIATVGPPIYAQQTSRIPKIGYLATPSQVSSAHLIAAFKQGLRELGYIEGKTVLVEVRLAEGVAERLPQLARELVALKPDVIVASNDLAIASIRRETQTVPIVMAFSSDPAGAGFVASLAR